MSRLSKQRIIRNFNQAAADYEQSAVLQKTVAERLLSRLDLVALDPAMIIDAGAGTGMASRELSQRYKHAKVVQLDLSEAMLNKSRKKSPRFFSGHMFVCGDMEKSPLANQCSQLVFSSMTYQWCNDLDAAFAESARLLQANGLLMFSTLGPDTLKELRDSWAAVDSGKHVNTFYDMHDIGDAVVRAGFENVVMDVETITLEYQDCYSLMRDIKHIGAANSHEDRMRGLTGKKRLQQMIESYEQFRRNGRLPATYEVVYGHGWIPAHGLQQRRGDETYVSLENIGGRRGR